MFVQRPSRCAAVSAAVVLGAALWVAQPSDAPAQDARLAGQLLVATTELEGPVFAQTVIYMVRHDARSGAMGLIVNRPLGDLPMAVLLQQAGLPREGAKGSVKLHVGEMRAGYWIVVPSDDGILFDDAYDTKWDRAMAKRRINL